MDLKTKTASATFSALILLTPGGLLPADPTVTTQPPVYSHHWGIDDRVRLPEVKAQPTRRVQTMIRDVRAWTGWSDRRLATALGITHPTVAALAKGTSVGRTSDAEQIAALHDVVRQIYLLCGKDSTETDRVFVTENESGSSAFVLLSNGDIVAGYLAALDLARPRSGGKMLASRLPSAVRGTVPLHEG